MGSQGEDAVPNVFHVPDYLILPYGRAVRSDLQKIQLSAVSADGLYFSTEVTVVCISKSQRMPLCLSEFGIRNIGKFPDGFSRNDDQTVLSYVHQALKKIAPKPTPHDGMFLDYYFGIVGMRMALRTDDLATCREIEKNIGLPWIDLKKTRYKNPGDIWRTLLPIPEMQLYVQDPLASVASYEPNNNFRVDFGFWNGQQLIAVEIDGGEPEGYKADVRRDRLLRRAGVDVIHILNSELRKYKARALNELLPNNFFGYDWEFEGYRPDILVF
jgi:hypothetical protein